MSGIPGILVGLESLGRFFFLFFFLGGVARAPFLWKAEPLEAELLIRSPS